MSYTTHRESISTITSLDENGWTVLSARGLVLFSDTTDEDAETLILRMAERLEEWRPLRPPFGWKEELSV